MKRKVLLLIIFMVGFSCYFGQSQYASFSLLSGTRFFPTVTGFSVFLDCVFCQSSFFVFLFFKLRAMWPLVWLCALDISTELMPNTVSRVSCFGDIIIIIIQHRLVLNSEELNAVQYKPQQYPAVNYLLFLFCVRSLGRSWLIVCCENRYRGWTNADELIDCSFCVRKAVETMKRSCWWLMPDRSFLTCFVKCCNECSQVQHLQEINFVSNRINVLNQPKKENICLFNLMHSVYFQIFGVGSCYSYNVALGPVCFA